MLINVERSKRLPEGGGAPQALIDELGYELNARLAAARRHEVMQREPAARDHWARLYDDFIELEDDDDISAWVSRVVPYTMRIAALYAALDGQRLVRVHHLDAAAALVRYGLATVRYVVQEEGTEADYARIKRWLRQASPHGLTKSEVARRLGGKRSAGEIDAALARLVTLPHVLVEVVATGGRPATRYRVEEAA